MATITLTVNGEQVEMSVSRARILYDELREVFGDAAAVDAPQVVYPYPVWPHYNPYRWAFQLPDGCDPLTASLSGVSA